MDTIKSLKSKTELLCCMKKGIKNETTLGAQSYKCIAFISEEKNLKNSLLYLNPMQKKKLLDAYTYVEERYYNWKREHNLEWVSAIDEIIINAKKHKSYLDNITAESYLKYIEAVGTMMKREGVLEKFFSMDTVLMCRHINAMQSNTVSEAFGYLSYFEEGNYFIHSLTSSKWKKWHMNCHIENFKEKGIESELKMFCSKDFQQHEFLSFFSSEKMLCDLLLLCKKSHGVIELLDVIAENDKSVLEAGSVHGSSLERLNLNVICDYSSYASLLRAIVVELEGVEFNTLIGFLVCVEHDERVLKGLLRKLKEMDELSQQSLFTLPPYMICAWINGKNEIISLAEKQWFMDYEPCVKDGLEPFWCYKRCTLSNRLLVYAVKEKKNHFIHLLINDEIGYDEFSSLEVWSESLLRYMNINELNARQIQRIVAEEMIRISTVAPFLPEGRKYTFNELEVLHEISTQKEVSVLATVFITLLDKLRSDDACLRMKQYIHFMPGHLSNIESDFISNALVLHDIPQWKKLLFTFEAPLSLVAETLPLSTYQGCLREAQNEVEARFVLNHVELCDKGLNKAFEQFCEVDSDVLQLKDNLKLPEQFCEDNKMKIRNFFISGNARVANTYLNSLSQSGFSRTCSKYMMVIKAAMCDCLHNLRYYERDLEKECSMNLSEQMKDSWMQDDTMSKKTKTLGELVCMEDTSFEGIMNMGINPIHTCMSYYDGQYLECLLSYFDGNKKIIYIKTSSGKIIARAVLRLTKMVIGAAPKTTLDFVDVTAIVKKEKDVQVEYPVIFLERMYSGYQGGIKSHLEDLCREFVERKAKEAGVTPVISRDYSSRNLSDIFSCENVGIYITKSKAGDQYLDSFGGKKSRTDEGNGNQDKREDVYVFSKCFVPKEYFE